MKKLLILSLSIILPIIGVRATASSPASEFVPAAEQEAKWILYGQASWYSHKAPGVKKRTANNEIFNDQKLTAAMWGVPFQGKVRVTNLENGKSVVVRINDRGPHGRYFRAGRIIDLTKKAFSHLSSPKSGLIQVKVEYLEG